MTFVLLWAVAIAPGGIPVDPSRVQRRRRNTTLLPGSLGAGGDAIMKCQKCAKPATFHITDIERGKPREYPLLRRACPAAPGTAEECERRP